MIPDRARGLVALAVVLATCAGVSAQTPAPPAPPRAPVLAPAPPRVTNRLGRSFPATVSPPPPPAPKNAYVGIVPRRPPQVFGKRLRGGSDGITTGQPGPGGAAPLE
jgi:hypothetical protein